MISHKMFSVFCIQRDSYCSAIQLLFNSARVILLFYRNSSAILLFCWSCFIFCCFAIYSSGFYQLFCWSVLLLDCVLLFFWNCSTIEFFCQSAGIIPLKCFRAGVVLLFCYFCLSCSTVMLDLFRYSSVLLILKWIYCPTDLWFCWICSGILLTCFIVCYSAGLDLLFCWFVNLLELFLNSAFLLGWFCYIARVVLFFFCSCSAVLCWLFYYSAILLELICYSEDMVMLYCWSAFQLKLLCISTVLVFY